MASKIKLPKTQWEYMIADQALLTEKDSVEILDKYGSQGWELISVSSNGYCVFKRETIK